MLKLLKPSLVNVFLTGFTGSFILSILALFPLNSILPGKLSTPVTLASSASKASDPQPLSQEQTYQGLPVAKVESFSTPNSWGTVVYLPQYHRSTGSNPRDKVNDPGAKTQGEIYSILQRLTDKFGLDFIMDEGNLYGEVPVIKIATLVDKITKRNELASLCQILKETFAQTSLNPQLENKLLTNLDNKISQIDREIALEGAPEKLKAEGKNIKLYGAENPNTWEEAKLVLRDFIFLQDRIKELEDPTPEKNSITLFKPADPVGLTSLLKRPSQSQFQPLISQALSLGDNNIAQVLQKTETALNDLNQNTPQTIMLASDKNTPSRQDNPYRKETNKQQLKARLSETEVKMEEIVVVKRNKDAAENFAKALKEQNRTLGILQFGAGHQEGLIKELQSQGLSVIVVTPQEVNNRQAK